MKLCRYDEDRLGVVIDDMIHDISELQNQIRAEARYDMRGDAVIAALPQWRTKMEQAAAQAPGKPISEIALLPPVARPSKVMAAPCSILVRHWGRAAITASPNMPPSWPSPWAWSYP